MKRTLRGLCLGKLSICNMWKTFINHDHIFHDYFTKNHVYYGKLFKHQWYKRWRESFFWGSRVILFKMGHIFCSNERCNRDMWVVEHLYRCIENVIIWHVCTCDWWILLNGSKHYNIRGYETFFKLLQVLGLVLSHITWHNQSRLTLWNKRKWMRIKVSL
jgi:hypothetical protein